MSPAEVARSYLESFAAADPAAIAAHVTDDFVNEHHSRLGSDCVGRAEYERRLPNFLRMMAGVTYEVEELVADGQSVMAAYAMRARWQGDKPFEVRGVQRFVIRDGRISRRTDYWDSLDFLLQVDPALAERLTPWL